MKRSKTTIAAAFAATTLSAPALAQEAEFQLPDACNAAFVGDDMDHSGMNVEHREHSDRAGHNSSGMMAMDMTDLPGHVRENIRKMMITMPAMQRGMMNADADLAFVCGMIAHHQGAIDMAQVLLDHGEDPQMRDLAENIIAAQKDEIDHMKMWLEENAD